MGFFNWFNGDKIYRLEEQLAASHESESRMREELSRSDAIFDTQKTRIESLVQDVQSARESRDTAGQLRANALNRLHTEQKRNCEHNAALRNLWRGAVNHARELDNDIGRAYEMATHSGNLERQHREHLRQAGHDIRHLQNHSIRLGNWLWMFRPLIASWEVAVKEADARALRYLEQRDAERKQADDNLQRVEAERDEALGNIHQIRADFDSIRDINNVVRAYADSTHKDLITQRYHNDTLNTVQARLMAERTTAQGLRDGWEQTAGELEVEADRLRSESSGKDRTIENYEFVIKKLRADLEQAKRNDQRGPDGRFVGRVKNGK